MSKNKTVFIFINGFGCNTSFQQNTIFDTEIIDKIEDVLKSMSTQKDDKYIVNDKVFSLNEIKKLTNKITKLKSNNIVYNLAYVLKSKYILNILNDLYLIYLTQIYNIDLDLQKVHILCDTSTVNQIKNITTHFCNLDRYSNRKSMNVEDNKYYEVSLNCVLDYLKHKKYTNIIVIGYSYGGATVSKIAKYLHNSNINKSLLSKLQMATVGSPYIPPYIKTNKIKLYHYVYKNDPAYTTCARIKDLSLYNNLFIMPSTNDSFNENDSFMKLINDKNRESHGKYNDIIKTIVKKNNTKIDINKLE